MRSFQNRFRSAFKSLHDSIRSKPRRRLSQFDCSRSLAAEFLEDRCLLAAGAFDTSFAGIGQKTVAFDRGGESVRCGRGHCHSVRRQNSRGWCRAGQQF